MSIVEALSRGRKRKKINDDIVVEKKEVQTNEIDTKELSGRFSLAKREFSEITAAKQKLDNEPSPLKEMFTDTWSKRLNHFRKRGCNGFKYVAHPDAQTYLSILRIQEKIITEKRRIRYWENKTIESDLVQAHQKILQLVETATTLPNPCQLCIQNSNGTSLVMSNDFKALIPENQICESQSISSAEYQRVQAQKIDVRRYITDAEREISNLRQSIAGDDLENFIHVRQRKFKYEHRHEQFNYTQYCLCTFCTQDIFHLNEMLDV